jgi:hypothetical protein
MSDKRSERGMEENEFRGCYSQGWDHGDRERMAGIWAQANGWRTR